MTVWTLYIHRCGSWRKIGSCRRCTQEAALYVASRAVRGYWPVKAEAAP